MYRSVCTLVGSEKVRHASASEMRAREAARCRDENVSAWRVRRCIIYRCGWVGEDLCFGEIYLESNIVFARVRKFM